MKIKNKQVSIRMEEHMYEVLERIAEIHDVSIAELIRKSMEIVIKIDKK